jgi:3-oxoacyl-[acyl-carrier-protein] synthase II
MPAYIISTGVVIPEKSEDGKTFRCPKPEIREFIDPKESRRFSGIIKNGIFAGMTALKNGGIKCPDAIITGTGLGCLSDTIKFISSIKQGGEENLNPAPFIYSTHNTVGGTISILTGCTGYNSTFVHRGISFESALFESFLMSREEPELNILCGGVDEITNEYLVISERIGLHKEKSIPGEGAGFVVLTGKKDGSVAEISDIKTVSVIDKMKTVKYFREFIEKNKIDPAKTVLFAPFNGDSECDNWKKDVLKSYKWSNIVNPKEVTGEFMTAGALSTVMAVDLIIKDPQIKQVLVWNSFLNMENAFIFIKNGSI